MAVDDVILREPTERDILYVAHHLRDADRDELIAAAGYVPPQDILKAGVSISYAPGVAIGPGNRPWCIFGVVPDGGLMTDTGQIWLLGTDDIAHNAVAFTQASMGYIECVREQFPRLGNWVDVRNTAAIRWLKRLGFTMEPAMAYGVEQRPFHRFHIGF